MSQSVFIANVAVFVIGLIVLAVSVEEKIRWLRIFALVCMGIPFCRLLVTAIAG